MLSQEAAQAKDVMCIERVVGNPSGVINWQIDLIESAK